MSFVEVGCVSQFMVLETASAVVMFCPRMPTCSAIYALGFGNTVIFIVLLFMRARAVFKTFIPYWHDAMVLL